MAAAVDETKLFTHDLKEQVQAVATEIGSDRARELQKGEVPKTKIEKRFVRLFLVMEGRGLSMACIPTPKDVRTIRPVARLQQQHPQLRSWITRADTPAHPVNVPNMAGNH